MVKVVHGSKDSIIMCWIFSNCWNHSPSKKKKKEVESFVSVNDRGQYSIAASGPISRAEYAKLFVFEDNKTSTT